jgi:hypothetical protein
MMNWFGKKKTEKSTVSATNDLWWKSESLTSHAYARFPHRGRNDRCFTGIVLCACIILGCVLPSSTVNLLGVIRIFPNKRARSFPSFP